MRNGRHLAILAGLNYAWLLQAICSFTGKTEPLAELRRESTWGK